jgi:hypothetical protein
MDGICNLQQSSLQAEDALSQGMEALQHSLAETLASGSLGPVGSSGNVANYMGQMAMAMGKLGTLESFLRQVINCIVCFHIQNILWIPRLSNRNYSTCKLSQPMGVHRSLLKVK